MNEIAVQIRAVPPNQILLCSRQYSALYNDCMNYRTNCYMMNDADGPVSFRVDRVKLLQMQSELPLRLFMTGD
jgi:hypothetical protein